MDFVKHTIENGVARVSLNRPEKLNALNAQVLDELETTFIELQDSDQTRVIIVTGAGEKSFAAGADISQFPKMSPEQAYAFALRGQEVFSLIESSTKPVIAAVNGFALGGGCELAMACHLRYASENAKFGQPEVKIGVIAGFGGSQRLSRLVGTGRALDLLLSGRMIDASEAKEMGLVNAVFKQDELLSKVEDIVQIIMQQSGQAQAMTLKAVYAGAGKPLSEGLVDEAEAFREVFTMDDYIEGANAFLERRIPIFNKSQK